MQHRSWKTTNYQPSTLIAVVVLVLIFFVTVAYFFMLPDVERDRAKRLSLADLARHAEMWETSRPESFEYVVERDCYCQDEYLLPYKVTVEGGARSANFVRPPDTGPALPPQVQSLEELFDMATEAATNERNVKLVFDARFGYLSQLRIDDSSGTRGNREVILIRDFDVIAYD